MSLFGRAKNVQVEQLPDFNGLRFFPRPQSKQKYSEEPFAISHIAGVKSFLPFSFKHLPHRFLSQV